MAELVLVGAGRDDTSIGAGRLTSFTADEEVELIVDVDSAVRGVQDDGWLGGNSRVVAGLPLVLRLASFFLFISISISASHDTFTGGGQTHSLNQESWLHTQPLLGYFPFAAGTVM